MGELAAVVDIDRFVGIPEAARILNVHPVTARRMVRQNRFPVPVRKVAGKQVVSLRRLVEHVNAEMDAAS